MRSSKGTPKGSMNPSRDKEILRMRETGLSYQKLGKLFDLSYERIRVIVAREKRERGEG